MKVLIYQDVIPHYREAVFNKLGESCDLTVAYTTGNYSSGEHYKALKVNKYKVPKIGIINGPSFWKAAKQSDVVISMCVTGNITMELLRVLKPSVKRIFWGIGVNASYTIPYDSVPPKKSFYRLLEKSDALLFYSDYPKNKYAACGIPKEKIFVANNTVKIKPIPSQIDKSQFLFIGTLYNQKGVDELIKYYAEALKQTENIYPLVIIGDGPERENLENLASDLGVAGKVVFKGKITDEDILSNEFSKSLLCISPNQAGLSVLKSMGYSVAFVTNINAITGGEIFNIQNGETGILMDSNDELPYIFAQASDNPEKYIQIGNNAKKHYDSSRKVEDMVKGFIDAINYVTK